MKTFLRVFYRLLYHQFAFTYDLVSAAVSFNRWNDWVRSVIPLLRGQSILEIGHGPGHLQKLLIHQGRNIIGLDESAQMGRIARRRTGPTSQLTRGLSQSLPFADASFETIVSTFPAEYITDPRTVAEVKRCLRSGGQLVILPVAWPKNRFLTWLFKVTGEAPATAHEVIMAQFQRPYAQAGFETEAQTVEVTSGTLLLLIAKKPAS